MSERMLRCPSCDGPMRVAERRGVSIDICSECRGVFLDRGELDKLLDAAAGEGTSEYQPPPIPEHRDDRDWSDERDRQWDKRRRRRRSFLDDIFDFD